MPSSRRTRQAGRASNLARKQANLVAPGDGPEPEIKRKRRRRKKADPTDRLVRLIASWVGTMPLESASALQDALRPSEGWEQTPGMESLRAIVRDAIIKRRRHQRSDFSARQAALKELSAFFERHPAELREEALQRLEAVLARGEGSEGDEAIRDVARVLRAMNRR